MGLLEGNKIEANGGSKDYEDREEKESDVRQRADYAF